MFPFSDTNNKVFKRQARCPKKLMRKTSDLSAVFADAKGENLEMFPRILQRRLSSTFSPLTRGTEEFTPLPSAIAAGRPAWIQSRRVTESQNSSTTLPSDPQDPPPELAKTLAANALSVSLEVWA